MGERRKGTRTHIEKESIKGPKGESSSTQDSSLDPTAPLPPPPWTESTRGKEPEGRQPLDDPPETVAETRSLHPEETDPFTQTRLQAGIANFRSLCEGSLEQVGLLLSEIAQYPLPPTVEKIILGFENNADAQLFPELFTTSQLSTAILDSDDNITPQWYIEPLERHIQRFQHATTAMNDIEPKLKTWYKSTEGGTASAGHLLAELAPEPDRGKPCPNGMIQLMLRTEKGAQNYSWSQLTACLARSLDVQDTTASISWILEEFLPPTDQSETGTSSPPQTVHLDMDPS